MPDELHRPRSFRGLVSLKPFADDAEYFSTKLYRSGNPYPLCGVRERVLSDCDGAFAAS